MKVQSVMDEHERLVENPPVRTTLDSPPARVYAPESGCRWVLRRLAASFLKLPCLGSKNPHQAGALSFLGRSLLRLFAYVAVTRLSSRSCRPLTHFA